CILLKGRAGQGRTFAFRKLAERRGCNLLILKTEMDPGTAAAVSALYNALVLVPDAEEHGESWIVSLEERCGILLLTSKDMGFSPAGECALLERELPDLGAEERLTAFRYWFGGESAVWEEISRFYAMTPGQIMEAARRIRGETLCQQTLSEAEKLEELRSANSREFAGNAQLFRTNKTMEDLILPPAQKQQILDICAFAKARYRVFRDWGFEKKIPYGRGISALFYGASGTGKTLAASVVANELGLRLYRVDISQVISKYIGETQKNIGRIFDSAQNSGCILFFDEADALFSRRSDAGDSQDKYSNAEIAYLLQRTDQFDGIILMATNLFQNFDEAFRRRIGYMVYFPVPDEKMRRTLWEHIFPEEAPKEELDYGLLADHLELTGAGIRNAAVNAAYLAASQERPISMADVVEAARLEYNKQGKAFPQKLGMMFSSERSRIE
ncbi:MAG TPA: ATP-binding protein, partial [Oscillospiraceae bacterium]|nr:ATP-binding protein [Oscillospiraceae bacterium]